MATKKKMAKKPAFGKKKEGAKDAKGEGSPQDRFKAMLEAKKGKGKGKDKKQKASITAKKVKKVGSTKTKLSSVGAKKKSASTKLSILAKKAKVVKHKKKGRV